MSTVHRTTAALAAALAIAAGSAPADARPAQAAPVTTAVGTVGSPKVPSATTEGATFLQPGESMTATDPYATRRTLVAGGLAQRPGYVGDETSPGLDLRLQPDGNLVEYRQNPDLSVEPIWWTGTHTGRTLIFQADRNVVLYDAAGQALWSTGTAGSDAEFFDVYGDGQIVTQNAAGVLRSAVGPTLTAFPGIVVVDSTPPFHEVSLVVQSDGNVVEYRPTSSTPVAVWSTKTAGAGSVRLAAQSDGNLVLYQLSTGRAIWQSHTQGPTGYYQLDAQADGNVVLYRTVGTRRLTAVWANGVRV